jgi:dTDP-4-dehydrorhamnose 3,5-epimerase
MEIRKTPIEGVFEIYPKVFPDSRGFFVEVFRHDLLVDHGIPYDWVQENQSFSTKGTVRALHFQHSPHAQAKLARVIMGKVLDVCVDLRRGSPTFGMHHAVILDSDRHNMLFMPEGFAHGFSALEDAIFIYKCSNTYHKESEGGILYNDPDLNINWGVDSPLLSDKDMALPTLKKFIQDSEGGL